MEAALKVYKSRVAQKVKYYRESGDLCEDEAKEIRKDLELEEFLPQRVKFKVEVNASTNVEFEKTYAFKVSDTDIASALADAIQKFLEAGVEISGTCYRFGNFNAWKGKVTFKDVEQEDYSYEENDDV